jgi:hypothetical protein
MENKIQNQTPLEQLISIIENATKEDETRDGAIFKQKMIQHDIVIKQLFPESEVQYIDESAFFLSKNGEISYSGNTQSKFITTQCILLKPGETYNCFGDVVYIYSFYLTPAMYDEKNKYIKHVIMRFYSIQNSNKIKKTFTISENIYNEFDILADKMAINKSKFVENQIVDFINKNK